MPRYVVHVIHVPTGQTTVTAAGEDLDPARLATASAADALADQHPELTLRPTTSQFMQRPRARTIRLIDPAATPPARYIVKLIDRRVKHCRTCTCATLAP